MQYSTVLQYSTVQMQYNAMQYNTVQRSKVPFSTMQEMDVTTHNIQPAHFFQPC